MGLAESRVALRLGVRIGIYLDTHPLGWLSGADGPFAFTADDCFLPDLAFVPRTPGTPPASLPTLVAEVLSDSNTAAEMAYKRAVYFAAGVQLVWEIDIQLRTVSVFTQPTAPPMILNRTHTLEGGTVLPGFRVALVDLFAVLEVD
jgi:Uma2 family endonuclease